MCKEKEKKLARPVVSYFQLFVALGFQLQSTNQGWPAKKSSVQGQVVKRGEKIRAGGTWVLFLFHNQSPGQRLDYGSAQIKIYMLTWAPVNNGLSARVNFSATLNQAVKSQEIPKVQILLQLCTGCIAWLSYCIAHLALNKLFLQ